MTHLRIIVADAHEVTGDESDVLMRGLVAELRVRGHEVDRVVLPFHADKARLLDQAGAWRMLNLSSSNARPVDLVIVTGFPAWFARHPRKVAWVAHDDRLAEAYWGTPDGDFTDSDQDQRLRQRLVALDARMLGECHRVFASARAADGLRRAHGIDARVIPLLSPKSDQTREATSDDHAPVWDDILEQLLG